MFKKIIISLVLLLFIFTPAFAQETQDIPVEPTDEYSAHVYFFHSESCPHCKDEMAFLIDLSKEEAYLDVQFLEFEITQSDENLNLFREIGSVLDLDVSGVPMTFIGNDVIVGYGSDGTTGLEIQKAIDNILENGDSDLIGSIISGQDIEVTDVEQVENEGAASVSIPESVHVPIFGDVKTANLSLPILSIFLGFIDGFNPCAMWVLVFLISLMMGMKDRKRMWILGTRLFLFAGLLVLIKLVFWAWRGRALPDIDTESDQEISQ